jgi:hypothetical protein
MRNRASSVDEPLAIADRFLWSFCDWAKLMPQIAFMALA